MYLVRQDEGVSKVPWLQRKEVGEIGIAQLDFSTQDGKEPLWDPKALGRGEIWSRRTVRKGDVGGQQVIVWLVQGQVGERGRRSGWEGKPGSNCEDYYPEVPVL